MIGPVSSGNVALSFLDHLLGLRWPRRPGCFSRRQFLLADDSAAMRFLLREYLAPTGADLVLVADGRQAVEAAAAHRFDLLLLDLSMPELDGAGALAHIRAGGRPTVPAVAVTAESAPDEVAAALRAGFAALIAKPVQREKLLQTIGSLIHS